MTTQKVVKSLHGIVPAHPEVGHVRDAEITSDLEPLRPRQGHSVKPRHVRDRRFYGSETPGGYLWVPPHGGEQVAVRRTDDHPKGSQISAQNRPLQHQ